MTTYNHKIKVFLEDQIQHIKNPKIIEFGVREGRSTKIFLELCKKNEGKLISIDIEDYSKIFQND